MKRRDFLKYSIGSILATSFIQSSLRKSQACDSAVDNSRIENTIIIGAGLAGLATAYKLTKAGVKCKIYEASSRFGGRVFTKYNFNQDNMFCELGGEFIDSDHTDIISLCRELNVEVQKFQQNSRGNNSIYFFDGQLRTAEELRKAFKPLAREIKKDLLDAIGQSSINEVPNYKNSHDLQKLDEISLEEYLHLKQKNVDKWFLGLLKVAYVGEYGLEAEEQSALNLLLLIGTDDENKFEIFGDSDEGMRVKGGNSKLPEALFNSLEKQIEFNFGCELLGIKDLDNAFQLTFQDNSQIKEIKAERVILALPFTKLREVQGIADLALSPAKLKSIRELGYGSNAKLITGFKSRFWQASSDVNSREGLGGYFYSDLQSQVFWETSKSQTGNSAIITNFLGGKAALQKDNNSFDNSLNDFSLINQGRDLNTELDGNRASMFWTQNPFARGSYSCPKPGQYTTLMGAAGESELNGRLLFAGEHCSQDYAGYMNGAVQSGNAVVKTILQNKK
jgi:monoamine oxidase